MDSCLNILIFSKYEYFKNHITLINEKAIGVFRNLERLCGWFATINSYLFSFVLLTFSIINNNSLNNFVPL